MISEKADGDVALIQRKIFLHMTPEEKLELSWRLYNDARRLKSAWLAKIHPDWSKDQIEKEVKKIFLYAHT